MAETFTINRKIIHGSSFAVSLDDVEFMTWRRNDETGDYWVKFHVPSGKEIRIKVTSTELEEICTIWCGYDIDLSLIPDEEEW
tara:strand:+ start:135 stop:383 length:249 start_codon:yes stop_codon:yes gene_type:complete